MYSRADRWHEALSDSICEFLAWYPSVKGGEGAGPALSPGGFSFYSVVGQPVQQRLNSQSKASIAELITLGWVLHAALRMVSKLSKLGLRSPEGVCKGFHERARNRAPPVSCRARAMSPSALAMNAASPPASAKQTFRYAAISSGVRRVFSNIASRRHVNFFHGNYSDLGTRI
jgi:hypothetical protein